MSKLNTLTKAFKNSHFSGLGNSEYITISSFLTFKEDSLLEAFRRAGFASRDKTRNEVRPCPTGTFLNASVSDPSKLQCMECPAGKSRDWFILYDTNNLYFSDRLSLCLEEKPKVEVDDFSTVTFKFKTDNIKLF